MKVLRESTASMVAAVAGGIKATTLAVRGGAGRLASEGGAWPQSQKRREEANQQCEEPLNSTESSVYLCPFTAARVRGVQMGRAGAGAGAFWEGWLMDAPGYLEEGLLHSEAGQQN